MGEVNQLARGRSVLWQAVSKLSGGRQDPEAARAAGDYLSHLESENARLTRELADVRNVLRNDIVSACIEGCHVAIVNHGDMRDGRGPVGDEGMSAAAEDGRALAEQWVEVKEAE